MRGQPLVQWILFALVWILLIPPIMRVTGSVGMESATEIEPTHLVPTWVTIKYSQSPEYVELFDYDTQAWISPERGEFKAEASMMLPFDAFGVEVRVRAKFSERITAMEMLIEPDGLPSQSRTLWLSGEIEEAFGFSGGRDD